MLYGSRLNLNCTVLCYISILDFVYQRNTDDNNIQYGLKKPRNINGYVRRM